MIKALFVGDGDELYLVSKLKTSFGIELTDAENARCRTMGDLEAIVWKHVAAHCGTQNRCMTAMAFYALRRALPEGAGKVRPSTPISELGMTHSQFVRALRHTGLHHPVSMSWIGCVGVLAFVGGGALCLFHCVAAAEQLSSQPLLICAATAMSALLGYLAVRADPGYFQTTRTVGDATRQLANENFAHFAAQGGRFGRERVWRILQVIAADDGGYDPDDIGYDTLIIHPRKKWFQIFR